MMDIRTAHLEELSRVGLMLVDVYSGIDGFPRPADQPVYYAMLLKVGELCVKPEVEIVVAVNKAGGIEGAVVYFGNMRYYASGGTATQEPNASGFRFMAVVEKSRGKGIGEMLTLECIKKARLKGKKTVIIHTSAAMIGALKMYEKLGFNRAADLDLVQNDLPVFGFRYYLDT
ncbi:GNAT family N-acetyltransferase [Fulvivirgaceae bacterium PWU4]|uniref:GNAT family N-acetyltransferase n=1 Tax=Chryseosolibacter histidini TaxID=2782349 RepID=A0AAP2GNH8_9BACT|nr:GNAT family N-acetyltransferase [Chryseosolibacter histidini]MBT1698033.1 GNAT family N-acetyltransferase [Chryseosolibacter histidini]